ncbi:cytochrome b562 [Celerinatantimonas yamalensis]|uniref:Cytochrome b562 n=1 Tax=Celerinatantimonas yamalensis TaxID=559956 RepID=A0ABW9GA63_9GAMM
MVKKLIPLLILCSSCVALPAFAAQSVGASMHEMARSYRAVMQDETLKSLGKDLSSLHDAALKAQAGVPDFLRNKPADDPMRQTYRDGIDKLLKQIELAQSYVKMGQLNKAKEAAKKIAPIRNTYHRKLGI